jgi:hypothetical protein
MIKNQTARSRWLAAAAAVSILGLAASSANAGEPQKSAAASDTNASVSSENEVRVYIDPKTHKIRQPTPEERAAEAKVASTKAAAAKGTGVKTVTYANGTKRALDTQGRLMESVIATKNADGSFSYSYVAGDGSQVSHEQAPAQMEEK